MNLKFTTKINSKLKKLDFIKIIEIGETELAKIPMTDFHAILGLSLTNQANDFQVAFSFWDTSGRINIIEQEFRQLPGIAGVVQEVGAPISRGGYTMPVE
jgi:hypothetical protein